MRPSTSTRTPVAKALGRCAPIGLLALLLNAAAPAKVLASDGWGHGGGSVLHGTVEGWGSGPITAEVQPGTSNPCDSSHQCEITVAGKGEARATLGQLGQFNLQAVVTVDLPDGTTNGFGGQCHPVTGSLSLTGVNAPSDSLVVDVQGVDCAVGSSTTLSAIEATYVVDGVNSTGKFAGATGTGTVGAATDSSKSPQTVEFAFDGSLLGPGNHHGNHHGGDD